MAEPKVFFVHLRRPDSASKNPDEKRSDPFYEFGSFGCTTCHSKNLLHPKHAEELKGARLAFVQGGNRGSRLVFLTPHITVKKWKYNCEARWIPAEMPFKYKEAPILVSNSGQSDFPLVKQFALQAHGKKIEGRLCSKIRSRAIPLDPKLAHEVIKVYKGKRAKASPSAIASTYEEALPRKPPKIDRNRKTTYRFFIAQRQAEIDDTDSLFHTKGTPPETQSQSRCGLSRCKKVKKR
jgi:hypothetical protein